MGLLTSARARSMVTLLAGGLLLTALGLHTADQGALRDAVLAVSAVLAGAPIAVRAVQALRVRAFSIDLLVTIAVTGALLIGEYVEAAVVSFLFLFGAWLEARTLERTRASLRDLVDLAPERATVWRGGAWTAVDAATVAAGEQVLVTSGERIAVDGRVASGAAAVVEASITGEPVPVDKGPGDTVYAGTLAESGPLQVVAERVGDDTTVARIVELVEEAQESRTRTQAFLERFAQVYTPAVVGLALLVYALTRDVEFALVFLVIACPGALVISVPVAIVAGMGTTARHGVLAKSGEALERLAAADVLVLDKTGTLTVGRPVVTAVDPALGTQEELLATVGALEALSEHHLGRAVVDATTARGIPLSRDVTDVETVKGAGLAGTVEGRAVVAGTRTLLTAHGVELGADDGAGAVEHERSGSTVVLVAVDGRYAGLVAVADAVRTEAAPALERLREHGIRRVVMLTGDNPHTAALVAGRLGVDEVRARLLPEDKVSVVRELQAAGHRVAMVGDGVNDAPALATADVGVAMGASGTDLSMESAEVVLMTDRLDQLAHSHRVARATVRVMKQNTALAVGTVLVLLAGVLLQQVNLAGGMLVHEASVLLVILNALRLVRHGDGTGEVAATAAAPAAQPTEARGPAPAPEKEAVG